VPSGSGFRVAVPEGGDLRFLSLHIGYLVHVGPYWLVTPALAGDLETAVGRDRRNVVDNGVAVPGPQQTWNESCGVAEPAEVGYAVHRDRWQNGQETFGIRRSRPQAGISGLKLGAEKRSSASNTAPL